MAKKPYAISAYQSAQLTTPPLQAVVLLYDGVLRRLKGAAAAARAGDLPRQLEDSVRATRILDGLDRSLDMEKGGKVAQGLRETYMATGTTLLRAVGDPNAPQALDKLVEAISLLRDAWAEIAGVPPLRPDSEKDQSDVEAS